MDDDLADFFAVRNRHDLSVLQMDRVPNENEAPRKGKSKPDSYAQELTKMMRKNIEKNKSNKHINQREGFEYVDYPRLER